MKRKYTRWATAVGLSGALLACGAMRPLWSITTEGAHQFDTAFAADDNQSIYAVHVPLSRDQLQVEQFDLKGKRILNTTIPWPDSNDAIRNVLPAGNGHFYVITNRARNIMLIDPAIGVLWQASQIAALNALGELSTIDAIVNHDGQLIFHAQTYRTQADSSTAGLNVLVALNPDGTLLQSHELGDFDRYYFNLDISSDGEFVVVSGGIQNTPSDQSQVLVFDQHLLLLSKTDLNNKILASKTLKDRFLLKFAYGDTSPKEIMLNTGELRESEWKQHPYGLIPGINRLYHIKNVRDSDDGYSVDICSFNYDHSLNWCRSTAFRHTDGLEKVTLDAQDNLVVTLHREDARIVGVDGVVQDNAMSIRSIGEVKDSYVHEVFSADGKQHWQYREPEQVVRGHLDFPIILFGIIQHPETLKAGVCANNITLLLPGLNVFALNERCNLKGDKDARYMTLWGK